MIMGVKIRTMWMTPFYLFFGVLVIYIFQSQINLNKLRGFTAVFVILFIFSPFAYAYISITETDKRTDYPGKEIALEVQRIWDKKYDTKIQVVFSDEWVGGNLSYHMHSRPKWLGWYEGEVFDLYKNKKWDRLLSREVAQEITNNKNKYQIGIDKYFIIYGK